MALFHVQCNPSIAFCFFCVILLFVRLVIRPAGMALHVSTKDRQCTTFALPRGEAEAPPVADEARRKPGEQRSLPNGREGRRLLRT